MLGVEILTEALRNPIIVDVFGANRNRLTDALVSCLTEGSKAGTFVPYDDPRAMACMVLYTVEGLGLRTMSNTTPGENSILSMHSFIFTRLEA